MREFNTFGPVDPRLHYHVNRLAVKAAMRAKIEKGRYFTLNAARQTGKTTLFREVIAELEAEGAYFGVLLDFELLSHFQPARMYERLGQELEEWRARWPQAPAPTPMRDHGDFADWLRLTVRQMDRRGLLIIDEFDALPPEIIQALLSQFRGMYLKRGQSGNDGVHSVILVGVRNIPSLLGGTQSPFNIADQFTVPYFTPDEVADLLGQHTAETGQPFTPDVVAAITRETGGQPFLVNRLGQLLSEELAPDRGRPITRADLDYALALLLTENNTHFSSILSRATPHRASLWRLLFYDERRTNFLDPVTQELIMYGVLRVVEDARGLRYARLSNPIYRKMLLLRFIPPPEQLPVNGNGALSRYVIEGVLNFDGLLDSFRAFTEEHGVRLLRSEATGRPLEISGQYLLLSYLSAALNSVGGHVTIESLSSAGEMDLLAFYREQRFIVETKIWRGRASYEQGQVQLAGYLRAASLEKGYLVMFDENVELNPMLAEFGPVFEAVTEEKTVRVHLLGINV
ncbi:MAG: ATP-binding protein [Chloroflexi bacterium]|nr:ATP-binding protein [Chloroflexota bacterium]